VFETLPLIPTNFTDSSEPFAVSGMICFERFSPFGPAVDGPEPSERAPSAGSNRDAEARRVQAVSTISLGPKATIDFSGCERPPPAKLIVTFRVFLEGL